MRDGFLLALRTAGAKGRESGIELVIEDDQRKPDIAVRLADKMIQSEKVDVADRHHLVEPGHGGGAGGDGAGQVLSVVQCGAPRR